MSHFVVVSNIYASKEIASKGYFKAMIKIAKSLPHDKFKTTLHCDVDDNGVLLEGGYNTINVNVNKDQYISLLEMMNMTYGAIVAR